MLLLVSICSAAAAQTRENAATTAEQVPPGIGADIKAYVTSPSRWRGKDWLQFSGALVAVGASYQYDNRVRDHFVTTSNPSTAATDSHDLEDAVPAAVVLGGTWLAANLMHDRDGRREARAMFEAAALGTATSYVIKELAGRQRPFDETGRGSWQSGGDSFPSVHASAAFAIGTVLAESGNDKYRWVRRVLGYGIATGTAYRRVENDAHWLSDTVAGAAIGVATARFVMGRERRRARGGQVLLVPTDGGLALAYSAPFAR